MLILESQILEVLRKQNHWWQRNTVLEEFAPPQHRLAFYEILQFLNNPDLKRAILLSGARRVGKTVILHQLVRKFINDGTPPKKILYVTFEDLTLTQATLSEILTLYERNIETIDEQTLILLDEIHYAAHWSRWLMTAIRDYPKARIVITGSASMILRNNEKNESGVGRWFSIHIPTLSFYEYIQLRKMQNPSLPSNLTLESLIQADAKERETILSACLPLQLEFNRYLLQGGFPATISDKISLAATQRLLREDVIDKALKRDMAHLYGVRSLSQLDQLFVYLCFNTGAIIEKSTLANALKVTSLTVESHLQHLEDAHLIYRLPPFRLEGKKSLKPRPKVYIADTTLRNAVILHGESIFDNPTELGVLIESCIFKHLYAFYYSERPQFGYWRASKNDKEVDFLLAFPDGKRVAYEVKYRERTQLDAKEELVSLINSSNPPDLAFLITKNPTDYGTMENGKIFQIPAFLFTYLLGHIEQKKWNP